MQIEIFIFARSPNQQSTFCFCNVFVFMKQEAVCKEDVYEKRDFKNL